VDASRRFQSGLRAAGKPSRCDFLNRVMPPFIRPGGRAVCGNRIGRFRDRIDLARGATVDSRDRNPSRAMALGVGACGVELRAVPRCLLVS
jgi:hypothetical protein